jgi:hypothetical protein
MEIYILIVVLVISIALLIYVLTLLLISKNIIKKSSNEILEKDKKIAYNEEVIGRLEKYSEVADTDEYLEERTKESEDYYNQCITEGDDYYNSCIQEGDTIYNKQIAEWDSVIENSEVEAKAINKAAEEAYKNKLKECEKIIEEAKEKAKKIKEQIRLKEEEAGHVLGTANDQYNRIIEEAKVKAEEIAGDAYHALENHQQLESASRAIKNVINGYGDQYLINTESWIDEIAENWGHKEAGRELKATRIKIKQMLDDDIAADCGYVQVSRRKMAILFVIDAFNGKCDSIISKAKHDNYGKLKQKIKDAYGIVKYHGQPFKDARITDQYLNAKIDELYWACAARQLELRDKEEQREIKSKLREEAKAIREYEKAIKEAKREEDMIAKAVAKAKADIEMANEEEKIRYEEALNQLLVKLEEAEEKNQRAISMAQQTRRGHVYVISNIGSFGEDVFKIGLTRRLVPMDRVKELGDASVPFPFDVHAMIYTEDAPDLESSLHRTFEASRINLVNHRKEFFRVSLRDIRNHIEDKDIQEVKWTMKAEAQQYRESQALTNADLAPTQDEGFDYIEEPVPNDS